MPVVLLKSYATGAGEPQPLNLGTSFGGLQQGASFGTGVGLLFHIPSGVTATATVQVSGLPSNAIDNPWNNHDVLSSKSASQNSSIQYPVGAVRLNVASLSGTPPEGGRPYVALWVVSPGSAPFDGA